MKRGSSGGYNQRPNSSGQYNQGRNHSYDNVRNNEVEDDYLDPDDYENDSEEYEDNNYPQPTKNTINNSRITNNRPSQRFQTKQVPQNKKKDEVSDLYEEYGCFDEEVDDEEGVEIDYIDDDEELDPDQMKKMEKMDQIRMEHDRELTFHPKLVTRNNAYRTDDPFSHLYSQAKQYEAKRSVQIERHMKETTPNFKPTTFTNTKNTVRTKNLMDRYNEYKEKGEKVKMERLLKQKQKQDTQEKEFTFKPEITERAKSLKSQYTNPNERFEKLYQHSKEKEEHLKQKSNNQPTFKPQITKMAENVQPAYLKPKAVKVVPPEETKYSFKPEISRMAQDMPERTFDQLYNDSRKIKKKKEQLAEKIEQDLKNELESTRAPRTKTNGPTKSFWERIDEENEHYMKSLKERELIKQIEETNHPFKPQITSTIPINRQGQVFEHLYEANAQEKIEKLKQEEEEKQKMKYTFKPEISEKSKLLTKDLPKDNYIKPLNKSVCEEIPLTQSKIKPPAPKRNGPPVYEVLYKKGEKLLRERKSKVEDPHLIQEQRELEECTFQPQLCHNPTLQYCTPKVDSQRKNTYSAGDKTLSRTLADMNISQDDSLLYNIPTSPVGVVNISRSGVNNYGKTPPKAILELRSPVDIESIDSETNDHDALYDDHLSNEDEEV